MDPYGGDQQADRTFIGLFLSIYVAAKSSDAAKKPDTN